MSGTIHVTTITPPDPPILSRAIPTKRDATSSLQPPIPQLKTHRGNYGNIPGIIQKQHSSS